MSTRPARPARAVRLVVAVGVAALLAVPVAATAQTTVTVQRAETILPPGNSQTYTADGEAARTASGDPDDAGPWIDDQREMYFDYEMKDATFVESVDACEGATDLTARDREAGVEPVRDGVDVCWDEFGVPAVFGETEDDVWYGHGWAAAKLRLFLLEGAVRTGMGTLAELAGEGSDGDGDGIGDTLEQDIERRTTRYTVEELGEMVDALSPQAQAAIDNYVAGVNAYIGWVTTTGRDQLPAEYTLLTSEPTPITREGVAAVGIEMVRFVASEGRHEILTAQTLRQLENAYGTDLGRRIFRDLHWQEDGEAVLTVLPEEGVFPRTDATAAERLAAFEAMADFAGTVPLDELVDGPGIAPWVRLETPRRLDSDGNSLGDGTGDEPFITDPLADPTAPTGQVTATSTGMAAASTSSSPAPELDVADRVRRAFHAFASGAEGASWMVMMAPSHTAGETLLMSEPQLDYDSGNFLMEVQLSGPGINARGSTVAGIPIVGIGYTPDVAWALTTGNAKTIDGFVEQSRPDSNQDGAPEYFHDGSWKDMDCHTETVNFRATAEGVPVGPDLQTQDVQICRTVHGPVVSHTQDWSHALSWQWHVRDRELETIAGTLEWQGAETLADIERSIPQLTWNENIGAVDRHGRIGFWHPGVHLERTTTSDLRLPIPGTGEHDLGDPLPQDALPHVVDPDRGWIVNWNNKPAAGWLDGGAVGTTSYPAGPDQRAATLADIVAGRDDWTFDDLIEIDREVSQTDLRSRSLLPFALEALDGADLDATGRAALGALAAWDRNVLDGLEWPGFAETTTENPTTVGTAPTIFDELVEQLDRELFTEVTLAAPLLVAQQYMGRHIADTDTHLHLAMRILDPEYSSLEPLVDYTGGRTPEQVVRDAFTAAVDQLRGEQGEDVSTWRSVYFDDGRGERGGKDGEVCTATGVLGPCGRHYYIERGAWVHHVGFGAADAGPTEPAPDGPDEPTTNDTNDANDLAATGGGAAVVAALLLLGAVVLRRRTVVDS